MEDLTQMLLARREEIRTELEGWKQRERVLTTERNHIDGLLKVRGVETGKAVVSTRGNRDTGGMNRNEALRILREHEGQAFVAREIYEMGEFSVKSPEGIVSQLNRLVQLGKVETFLDEASEGGGRPPRKYRALPYDADSYESSSPEVVTNAA